MSAKSNVPWSVKGIDPDARSVAKELARRRGMTLGEFITDMIREKGLDETAEAGTGSEGAAGEKVVSGVTTDQLRAVVDTLNRLNERLKSAETALKLSDQQSREAMGGLNRGLETVFERVKRLERGTDAADTGRISDRLERLEDQAEKNSWVKSLVALERALSTLVEQVESSRDETEERLARNEDLIAQVTERLDAEDHALRQELAALIEAIDSTTERLSETEEQVQETLKIARAAAESHDETFIERTSQRLQLLGSEIKRTSDHIRSLETSVSRLSEKIEAGEERSAEGISRVAQSLETLRRQFNDQSLASGPDAPAAQMETAVSEAQRKVSQLQGAFAAVVDRLDSRAGGKGTQSPAPLSAAPLPDEALREDFAARRGETGEPDEFDRLFDDPLGLDIGEPAPSPPETGPKARTSEEDPAEDDTDPLDQRPEAEPRFFDERPRPEPERFTRYDGEFDDPEERDWEIPASSGNPFATRPPAATDYDRDELFRDDNDAGPIERLASGLRSLAARSADNNAAIGWIIVTIALAAIGFTALRLTGGEEEGPLVMEPMVMPAPEPVQQAAPAPDPTELYARAKATLAAAVTPSEEEAAVRDLEAAADAGSTLAQYDLGEMYLNGDGVRVNAALARRRFEEAAAGGHLRAVLRLGYLDINGIAGPVDPDSAIRHFTDAANAGLEAAMYNLGALYDPRNAYLEPARQNAVESYFWYQLAASRGDTAAAEKGSEIAPLLSDREIASADTRVATWRRQPLPR